VDDAADVDAGADAVLPELLLLPQPAMASVAASGMKAARVRWCTGPPTVGFSPLGRAREGFLPAPWRCPAASVPFGRGELLYEARYEFGDDRLEAERLAAVERAFDRLTRSVLLELGLRPGWRCWEVGAGRGSVARWLAGVVGPEGSVLATDLDERLWPAGVGNLRFARHDVTVDPPPADRLDLIHTRLLLEHLPDPGATISHLAAALRPGGILVAADAAGLEFRGGPAGLFEELEANWVRAGRAVGWDPLYGLTLAGDLRSAGLADVEGLEHRSIASGGPDWRHISVGLERLRGELVAQGVSGQALEQALLALEDPGNLLTGPPIVVAWGRRSER
jgi:SAM-dependent methyltransferase